MGTLHFPIVEISAIPFGLQTMSCPLIEEVWADEHEEPRLPATEEGALADLFDNELD